MAEYEMEHTGAELDEAIGKVLDGYKDVSIVTARAGDVVQGKTIVTPEGTVNGSLAPPSGTINITENDFYDVSEYAEAMVAVPDEDKIASNLSLCHVYPSTSAQVIRPSAPYDGFGVVRVVAVPSATQATPSISVNGSTGLITASAEQSAGLVEAGTKTATEQLSTQAAAEITPTTSQQTAVAAGKYTLGNVVVKPIPSEYIIPSGSVTLEHNGSYSISDKSTAVVDMKDNLVAISSKTPGAKTDSITFDVLGEPKKYICAIADASSVSYQTGKPAMASITYDGTTTTAAAFGSSGGMGGITVNASYSSGAFTLTVSGSNSYQFQAKAYKLIYVYDA